MIGLFHHAATYTVKKTFQGMEEDFWNFIKLMSDNVKEYDPCDIINIDQAPILYSYHSNRKIEMKAKKTVHVLALATDTKRVTVAITISVSGKMLLPILFFKGARNGWIRYCKLWVKNLSQSQSIWLLEESMDGQGSDMQVDSLVLIPLRNTALMILCYSSFLTHIPFAWWEWLPTKSNHLVLR